MDIREFPEIPSFMKHIATNEQGYLFRHIGPTIELTKPSRKVTITSRGVFVKELVLVNRVDPYWSYYPENHNKELPYNYEWVWEKVKPTSWEKEYAEKLRSLSFPMVDLSELKE